MLLGHKIELRPAGKQEEYFLRSAGIKRFASSKICSQCGLKKDDLKLADRIFICKNGCKSINRDWNAAKNLLNFGHDRIERDLKRTSELGGYAQC